MTNCVILSCTNSTQKNRADNGHVTFHRFPGDPKTKDKWIQATGRTNWFPGKYSTICSFHFTEDSFKQSTKICRLKTTATPTIAILQTIPQQLNTNQRSTDDIPLRSNTSRKRKLENVSRHQQGTNQFVQFMKPIGNSS